MPSDEAPIPETPADPQPDPWASPQGDAATSLTVVDGATLPTVTEDAIPSVVVDGATLPTVTEGAVRPTVIEDAIPSTVTEGTDFPTVADGVPLPIGPGAAPRPEDAIPAPTVTLDKPVAPDASAGSAEPVAPVPPGWSSPAAATAASAPRDPWAAPADTPAPSTPAPSSSSVHDRMTVVSMPGVDGSGPVSADSGGPASPQAPAAPQPWAGPGAFAPPGGRPAAGSTTPAPNPFAPPAPNAPGTPHASYPPPAVGAPYAAQGAAVPPPPLSPEGPGQVPYGYPQYPAYPGAHAHPGAGYPAPNAGYLGAGHPAPGAGYAWPVMAPPPSNGMGIAAMVLGICAAALFCLWPLAILLGIMAVIFGSIGRVKARRGEATNPGHALAGIICGVVGILLGIGFIVLIIVAPGSDGYDSDPDPFDDGYSTSLSLTLPAGADDVASVTDAMPRGTH
ncbi:DUF4190 domain-containing protein [Streptomyces europaeiscabiei]|uniref:DUF4190 domain-containing protein n=2 Tax=Streptomyces europaeiscabiei TaxID=146819 RepID=A0ABU4NKM7_9ACTN|nr:DUF4190 domain-containing protein [Streptomyces europaeiscabiei]MDX3548916.1 DUF4190 domain-containing protein [Streptomyces europaeiscabiei]MDX3555857.1 DUF4190 domain-containing protein [Streptomyces europaeiscabiei]MDX3703299.1 DUF4190 domain-containing protein [Streptomyces europaeiscabiei]